MDSRSPTFRAVFLMGSALAGAWIAAQGAGGFDDPDALFLAPIGAGMAFALALVVLRITREAPRR